MPRGKRAARVDPSLAARRLPVLGEVHNCRGEPMAAQESGGLGKVARPGSLLQDASRAGDGPTLAEPRSRGGYPQPAPHDYHSCKRNIERGAGPRRWGC